MNARKEVSMRWVAISLGVAGRSAALVLTAFTSACTGVSSGTPSTAIGCNDSLKTAFTPEANTTVVAVRSIKAGDKLVAVDSPSPITTAVDMCLVKLLVGPGVRSEPKSAPSYTDGIGIEVWLPAGGSWNDRIRNYGGGGWVGGGHRYPDQIGSKVPAIVNANMGYAVGTTDAGQPLYQDGSFILKADGKLNRVALQDFSYRSMVEQADKTRALVQLYYGRAAKYAYFDGHSQGGRQGLKVAQNFPNFYDGYLIAAPAINQERFGLGRLYTQVVMKSELGITAVDAAAAKAFAVKAEAAGARAVEACDKEKLGFLLDPFSCAYNPARDAAALCTGEAGDGVTGTNTNAATCLSAREATAINKIWYGPTNDGSFDANESVDARAGRVMAPKRLWWADARGSDFTGQITSPGTDLLVLMMQDASYASSHSFSYTSAKAQFVNASTDTRDRWTELTYAAFADAFGRSGALQPTLGDLYTDNADLAKARALGRKILIHHGLGEDVIPPAGMVNYYTRVSGKMGGDIALQSTLRMYMSPAVAHSSQGRAYTIGNARNNGVPQPKLPGNGNQTPTREQDQMFSALVDWVEKGIAPESIVVTSRDGTSSYPLCVYPKKITWDGRGSPQQASSYTCR
jgi:feruloyl esterase